MTSMPPLAPAERGGSVQIPTLDVGALIDQRPLSAIQALVAVLCGLAMFANGYDLQALALAVPSLAQQWHLPPSHFGFALAASSIGLAVGAIALAPLGDRLGRKPALIAAMALVGLTMLCTATATDPGQFVIWRFLTGLGMGFGIPNCNAWTAEYAPLKRRALILVLMNAAIAAGAFSAAIAAPKVIGYFGWQGTFLLGGVVPLLLSCVLFGAPESVKLLAARRPQDGRIHSILKRIAPGIAYVQSAVTKEPARGSVTEVLKREYRARTLLLWTVVVLNLFIFFVLISWLPTLLHSAGWSLDAALRGTAVIQAGGLIGGILLSFCVDTGKTLPALRVAFIAAAVCLALFRFLPPGASWNLLLVVVGAGISGAQLALNALSTAYYPPAIKATGMSWVGAVGQAGSIIAPLAGAFIIDQGIAATNILLMLSAPALLCAGVVLFMRQEWQAH